jgi:hypothetical protein
MLRHVHRFLDLSQVTLLFDQIRLDPLAVNASTPQPTCHHALAETARDDDGLSWSAMSHPGDHERHRFNGRAQTIQCRALGGREGLATLPTEKPLLRARVHTAIALANLVSRRARRIG